MTTGAEAVTTLKFRLNRSTNASTEFEAQLVNELNLAVDRLETDPELPEFLLSERAQIDLTEGEERVPLPADFLRENDEDQMQVQDTAAATPAEDYSDLKKSNLDEIRQRYPNEAEGRPAQYALQGDYFRIRPLPDKSTYKLWMTYYRSDSAIANGGNTTLWLTNYPDLVISEAGLVMAKVLGNAQALAIFTEANQRERRRLEVNEVAKKMANFNPNPED